MASPSKFASRRRSRRSGAGHAAPAAARVVRLRAPARAGSRPAAPGCSARSRARTTCTAAEPAPAGDRRLALDQPLRIELRPRPRRRPLCNHRTRAGRASRLRGARSGLCSRRRRCRTPSGRGRSNPGSEALHGYLMHRAGEPNPGGLLGAMWIVEGLGEKMARELGRRASSARRLRTGCHEFPALPRRQRRTHMNKLYALAGPHLHTARRARRRGDDRARGWRGCMPAARGNRRGLSEADDARRVRSCRPCAPTTPCPSSRAAARSLDEDIDNPLRWFVRPVLQFLLRHPAAPHLVPEAAAVAAVPRASRCCSGPSAGSAGTS